MKRRYAPGCYTERVMQEQFKYQERIVIDPDVMAGKPVVAGTRIPVDLVLKRLAQDLDFAALFIAYPRLTKEDVQACLVYANKLVTGEDLYLVSLKP